MIRAYMTKDRAAVEAHIVEFQEYERAMCPDLKRPGIEIAGQYLDYLLQQVKDHDGSLLVVEIDDVVCGYLAMWIEATDSQFCYYIPSFVRLSDIYVAMHARNKGVGAALMAEVDFYAMSRGQSQITLDVLSRNKLARDMYLKLGFEDAECIMIKKICTYF